MLFGRETHVLDSERAVVGVKPTRTIPASYPRSKRFQGIFREQRVCRAELRFRKLTTETEREEKREISVFGQPQEHFLVVIRSLYFPFSVVVSSRRLIPAVRDLPLLPDSVSLW